MNNTTSIQTSKITEAKSNYELSVYCSHSLDKTQWKPININSDFPVYLESELMECNLYIRIRNYSRCSPLNKSNSNIQDNNEYLEMNQNCLSSIQIEIRFKQSTNLRDLIFGNEFNSKLNLPYGTNLAVKFAKLWDPGLELDLYAEKPYAFSPFILTVNTINVIEGSDVKALKNGNKILEENNKLLTKSNLNSKQRKTYIMQNFKNSELQERWIVGENIILQTDFYNPYVDFSEQKIKLPVIDINILKFWDGKEPLLYVLKSKQDANKIYLIVAFELKQRSAKHGNLNSEELPKNDNNNALDVD